MKSSMIKHIKSLALTVLFVLPMAVAFTSCSSNDDPYFSANENDYPRILNSDLEGEFQNGVPPILKEISRTENFEYEVTVTPAHYSTVTWYIDGELVHEGTTIDMPLLAGEHLLKIVATTTKGLETSRTRRVIVNALPDDPSMATDAKSRWLTIGKTKSIDFENVTSVSKLFIGTVEATNVSFNDGKVTFDVPSMPEGVYPVTLVTGDGQSFGCGNVTVSLDDYVDPGIKETTIWEGDVDINWGDYNVFLSAEDLANVPVGATVRLVYEIIEADYHALRVTNQDWSQDIVPQIDGFDSQPNPFEFEYTADAKAIADAKGMLITGFGYKLTKVVIVEGVAPAETTLWEGGTDIVWGDSNVFLSADDLADVPVGATINLYFDIPEAEYHALRVTNQDWSQDIVPQIDGFDSYTSPFAFEYTADAKAIADDKGMLITGFGYKLTKVTFAK